MATLYTKSKSAEKLSISLRQLEKHIRNGDICVRRLGTKCVRIEDTELDRFVERQPREPVETR